MQRTEIAVGTKWSIDKLNSQIGFSVKYLMFTTVRGSFKDFDADIYTTADNFTNAEIDFRINTASIDTGVEQRDNHLKSADFFDVEKFSHIDFKATVFAEDDTHGGHALYGDLTIKGIKK
ncbi:MAG: YceI family protein, partial [Bacteroidota bacterium]